jgi:hypothetical protein
VEFPQPRDAGEPMTGLAPLLNLLSAGEHSAEAAFGRIVRRLRPAEAARISDALHFIQQDERRHVRLLIEASEACDVSFKRPQVAVRHFFARLESREPAVHLARIAALDACVCQVLSRVLRAIDGSVYSDHLSAMLAGIRGDEGHHVRIARTLSLELNGDPGRLQCVNAEVRQAFDRVLAQYEASFVGLRVDVEELRRTIRRDAG